MAGSVKSGVLEFSDDQKVFVAIDEDDIVKKAVLIDREGNETALGALPTDEQVQEAVDAWLDDHPEATTTVEDGAVTTAKIANGAVTDDKLAADGIKAKVSILEADVDDLKTGVSDINNEINKGVDNFGTEYEFVNGYISGGTTLPIGYRIVADELMMYDRNIEVAIADGFRMAVHNYNWDGTYLGSLGWKTGYYVIPAFKKFKIEIARTAEITTETADIHEFLSKCTFTTSTNENIKKLIDNPLVESFAHKGYSLTAPEETAPAFIEAKANGYTGVECDIQITSDGEYVLWHDDTLIKLGVGNPISNYTLAELEAMDFGSWKSGKYAGTKIQTFEEGVFLCKKLGIEMLIDTKIEFTEEQITELVAIVKKYNMLENVIWYINFNGGYLAKLKELYPRARISWIGVASANFCSIVADKVDPSIKHSVSAICDIIDLTSEDVERAHSYGISVGCYTSTNTNTDSIDYTALRTSLIAAVNKGIDLLVSDIYRAKDVIE